MNIYDLLSKPIEELSPSEQVYILESMSMAEFKTLQELERSMYEGDYFENEYPSRHIQKALVSDWKQSENKKIWNYSVALWKIVASLLVMIGGYAIWSPPHHTAAETLVQNTMRDTIYLVEKVVNVDTLILPEKKTPTHFAFHPNHSSSKNYQQASMVVNPERYRPVNRLKTFGIEELAVDHNRTIEMIGNDSMVDRIGFVTAQSLRF